MESFGVDQRRWLGSAPREKCLVNCSAVTDVIVTLLCLLIQFSASATVKKTTTDKTRRFDSQRRKRGIGSQLPATTAATVHPQQGVLSYLIFTWSRWAFPLLLIPSPLRVSDRFSFLFPLIFISSSKFAFLSARTRNSSSSRSFIMSVLVGLLLTTTIISTATARLHRLRADFKLGLETKLILAVLFTQSCVEWSRLMDFLITLGFCINKYRECRELQVVDKMLGWCCW